MPIYSLRKSALGSLLSPWTARESTRTLPRLDKLNGFIMEPGIGGLQFFGQLPIAFPQPGLPSGDHPDQQNVPSKPLPFALSLSNRNSRHTGLRQARAERLFIELLETIRQKEAGDDNNEGKKRPPP